MTATALIFNGVELSTITHNNQIWMTSVELAKALGYAHDTAITKLFNRNKDEFSASMTATLSVTQNGSLGEISGLQRKTRYFSLRGCHLIAFFASTQIAKLFRVWVLDILDKEVSEPVAKPFDPINDSSKINAWQKQYIRECVADKAYQESRTRQAIYWDMSKEFFVNSYHELPEQEFDAVALWLGYPWMNLMQKTIALTAERFGELCIYEEENKLLREQLRVMTNNVILGKAPVKPSSEEVKKTVQHGILKILDAIDELALHV